MRKNIIALVVITIFLVFISGKINWAAQDLAAGDHIPPLTLSTPADESQRAYLGISHDKSFLLPDIKAEVLIIEIFSMYCPHCQREAAKINDLYYLMENTPEVKGKIKIIGIGAGNDDYEVKYFKKKYNVPFPLFSDKKFNIHEKLGSVGTPYFFAVRLTGDKSGLILHTKKGGFESPQEFLSTVMKKAALE
ncbi:MAG: redoxin domain-containing protein [Syntrophales bacterium]|jgi:peroxiredoxin|nr:redoxin domain-containing protein [Syntrophales bacterium]MDY0043583.1 redoxin domain-containing protein [Syntrophales bacterium]